MNRLGGLLGTSAGTWAEPKPASLLTQLLNHGKGAEVSPDSPEGRRALAAVDRHTKASGAASKPT